MNDETPNTILDGAIVQHELYLSWVQAGFTPDQALELVKAVIIETLRGAREC